MRRIICGDIHLTERYISEIDEIFEKDIFPIKADSFLQLGDMFDKNTPSPLELTFASELILKIKQHYKKVIILSGTDSHDILHNESVISHLASLGVKTVKGDYIEDNILYGHWMLRESNKSFGSGKCGIKDLIKYNRVWLGHQHNFEQLGTNIIHAGNIRFCTFNEIGTDKRFFLTYDDTFEDIPITRCIPMIEVTDLSKLEQIDPHTKVRVIFNSFEDYKKNASYVNKIGKKFFLFKILMNFQESKILIQSSNKMNICPKNNLIQSYIDKIEDKDVRQMLEQQFKGE